jgi:predicted secreted protein
MNCRCIAFVLGILVLLGTSSVIADDEVIFNKVNLQAQAERDIPNDLMTVILTVEHQGKKPSDLAEKVNIDMQWAIERTNKYPEIKSSTKAYYTYPIYKDRLVVGWRASQQLELESEEIAELTNLVGTLQEKLQVKQMNFSPTRGTRLQIENELIEEALQAYRRRVGIVQKQMDNMDYRIIELHVNTGGQRPPVMYAERAMVKSMDARKAPAVEAGTSTLTVTVSGSVQFF